MPVGVNFADFVLDALAAANDEQRATFRFHAYQPPHGDDDCVESGDLAMGEIAGNAGEIAGKRGRSRRRRQRKRRSHSGNSHHNHHHHHHNHHRNHHHRHRHRHREAESKLKEKPSRKPNDDNEQFEVDALGRGPVLKTEGTFSRATYAVPFVTQFFTLAGRRYFCFSLSLLSFEHLLQCLIVSFNLLAICWFSLKHTLRTWRLLLTHSLVAVLLALFVGAIFWKRGTGLVNLFFSFFFLFSKENLSNTF